MLRRAPAWDSTVDRHRLSAWYLHKIVHMQIIIAITLRHRASSHLNLHLRDPRVNILVFSLSPSLPSLKSPHTLSAGVRSVETRPYPPFYQKILQTMRGTRLLLACVLCAGLPSLRGQLLGAGTGVSSCRAFPYRAKEVDWELCPQEVPCCNEYGYCRLRSGHSCHMSGDRGLSV